MRAQSDLTPSFSIVIATRNRPGPLRECLVSISTQTRKPEAVLVVDSSEDAHTAQLCRTLSADGLPSVRHIPTRLRGAARQRNLGIRQVTSEVTVFLDDDVVLEQDMLEHLLVPFGQGSIEAIGGVAGTIVNEASQPSRRLTRGVLRLLLGSDPALCPGRVVGPAVHTGYRASDAGLHEVEWMPAGCCAFWTSDIKELGFAEFFEGYSFMEDVELSARIGRTKKLYQATTARVQHKGLGGRRKDGWFEFGKSLITNRHYVMTDVLDRRGLGYMARLLAYDLVFLPAADVLNWTRGKTSFRGVLATWAGRIVAAARLVVKGSPYPSRKEQRLG